jgi:hypothetical protein
MYEGRLQSSWADGSAPLLCKERWTLLCQIVLGGGGKVVLAGS